MGAWGSGLGRLVVGIFAAGTFGLAMTGCAENVDGTDGSGETAEADLIVRHELDEALFGSFNIDQPEAGGDATVGDRTELNGWRFTLHLGGSAQFKGQDGRPYDDLRLESNHRFVRHFPARSFEPGALFGETEHETRVLMQHGEWSLFGSGDNLVLRLYSNTKASLRVRDIGPSGEPFYVPALAEGGVGEVTEIPVKLERQADGRTTIKLVDRGATLLHAR